jgi:hypothetical protein
MLQHADYRRPDLPSYCFLFFRAALNVRSNVRLRVDRFVLGRLLAVLELGAERDEIGELNL